MTVLISCYHEKLWIILRNEFLSRYLSWDGWIPFVLCPDGHRHSEIRLNPCSDIIHRWYPFSQRPLFATLFRRMKILPRDPFSQHFTWSERFSTRKLAKMDKNDENMVLEMLKLTSKAHFLTLLLKKIFRYLPFIDP